LGAEAALVDALVRWEFWAGVLLAGLLSLGGLLRWIMWGDGRTAQRLPSVETPLEHQQSPLTHAHDAAVAPQLAQDGQALAPTATG
jgi:hypothetical protein